MDANCNKPAGPPKHPNYGKLREPRQDKLGLLLSAAHEYEAIISFRRQIPPV